MKVNNDNDASLMALPHLNFMLAYHSKWLNC